MGLNLKSRRVLVTGASRGIGFGVARSLAAEGCHLHLAARHAEADQSTYKVDMHDRQSYGLSNENRGRAPNSHSIPSSR